MGHAVGVELLELVLLLTGGGEQDRLAGDRLDREGSAAAGVAVELGHDDAVEVDDLGELLGDRDGVLAGHRVDHKQHVLRLDRLLDVRELLHQLGIDVKAAAGVDDEDVLALGDRPISSPGGDLDRVAVGALLVDVDARLGADLDQLVDRGRPVHVARGDGDGGAVLAQIARELAGRRGLTRPLEAGHHDHSRRASGRRRAPAPRRPSAR